MRPATEAGRKGAATAREAATAPGCVVEAHSQEDGSALGRGREEGRAAREEAARARVGARYCSITGGEEKQA
jgi:hypothetical protein